MLGDNAPVDSWDLIFKPEYMEKLQKCGVAILDNGPELLPAALNYLGLPHHSQDPADYGEALLMKRPYVSYFHSSSTPVTWPTAISPFAVGFSGDILQAESRAREANNGVNIGYAIPKEGAAIWFDMVAMPVDAPDEKQGYAFMNYLLRPDVMASISNHVHYANGNQQADSLIDPAIRNDTKVCKRGDDGQIVRPASHAPEHRPDSDPAVEQDPHRELIGNIPSGIARLSLVGAYPNGVMGATAWVL